MYNKTVPHTTPIQSALCPVYFGKQYIYTPIDVIYPSSTHKVQVFLFGSFEVLLDGKIIQDRLWHSRQVRSVLQVLLSRRGKVTTSEQLIEKLWPDEDPETALKHLYVRISQLRKLLKTDQDFTPIKSVPGGYIFMDQHVDAQSVGEDHICPWLWVDVDEFEKAADLGARLLEQKQLDQAAQVFEQARQLHRGDYLAEDPYAEWTIAERERLNERYLVVLTELAEAYAQQGYFRRSINLCQQILCLDPWREAVFLRLMLYYYYAGEKTKALQAYEKCRSALKEHLGVEPDQHTALLAQLIQEGTLWSQPGGAAYPPSVYEGRMFEVPYSLGEPPFVGRERELAWLLDQWKRNPRGCAWVSGEAGVGKTRLAAAFCSALEKADTEVIKLSSVRSASDLYGGLIATAGISEAISQRSDLSTEGRLLLSRLLDTDHDDTLEGFPSGTQQVRDQTLCGAIVEILQAKVSPVLIYIDDAHELNESALQIVGELIGRVGLLLTSRVEDVHKAHPFARQMEAFKSSIRTRVLNPLLLEDVRRLLIDMGGEDVQVAAEDLFTGSHGNPLFLIASLQHLFEEGHLYVTPDGRWAQSGPFTHAIAPSVESAITQRLNLVQAEDRQFLDILAVAGGEADYDILQVVLDKDENALLASADLLISKGLIVELRDLYSADVMLAHGLYGEVLNQVLPKARRRILHRRIAETMLSTGRDTPPNASIIADHFHRGGEVQYASQYARIAGEHALRLYMPVEAIEHYQSALMWAENTDFEGKDKLLARVRLGMAEAHRYLGQYRDAIKLYQMAYIHLEDELKGAAIFQIFNLSLLLGKPLSYFNDLTADYEPILAGEEVSWGKAVYYWTKSYVALLGGDGKNTRAFLVEGWRAARAMKAREAQPPFWMYLRAYSILMRAHNQWGNYPLGIHFAERILAHGEALGVDLNTQADTSAALGNAYFYLGDYPQAHNAYQRCYQIAAKAKDPRLQGEALIGLGNVYFVCGEFAEAEGHVQRARELADKNDDMFRLLMAQSVLARIGVKTRVEPEQVIAMENLLQLARHFDAKPYVVRSLLILAEIQLTANEVKQAEAYAREAADLAERCWMKLERCSALRLLGQAQASQGSLDEARIHADGAVALAEHMQTPFELGLALRTRAGMQSEVNKAREDVKTALDVFTHLGASYEAEQTQAMLLSLLDQSGIN